MTAQRPRLIIVGGGLAGSLAALAIAQRRPDVDLLLVEQGDTFGGNHVWSFFDDDLSLDAASLIEPLVRHRWNSHEVRFPNRARTLDLPYNSVTSRNLDRFVRLTLRPQQQLLGRKAVELLPGRVILDDGSVHCADAIIDARNGTPAEGLSLAWQKFVGRTYRFEDGHGCARPIIMDALVDQDSGFRFIYCLPFSATELLVEDTYYSTCSILDRPLVGSRIDAYARRSFGARSALRGEEVGVLPIILGGEVSAFWPTAEPPVPRLGLRGGFFHPTTGYSLPDAAANALLLADQRDFSAPALHALLRARADRLWKRRSFYRLLNRMLFGAASPRHRYRVLEHFYRLPDTVIARFYAARLSSLDKLRIVTGKPPVPLHRAVRALASAPA